MSREVSALTVDVHPGTAKLIPATLLPEELRKIFPEGVVDWDWQVRAA